MRTRALVATILALPLFASAEPAKTDDKAAAQLAATFSEPKGRPSRAPNLGEMKQTKVELPPARTSEQLRVAEPRHLTAGAGSDNKIEKIEKSDRAEAKGSRSAYQPVPVDSNKPLGARMGRVRRAQLAAFDPRQLRSGTTASTQADEVARTWKSNLSWDVITVDSYASVKGRSEADMQKLAQRSADDVRTYLVRRGVPGDYVVAIGHASTTAPGAKVEISVSTCDDVTIACRKAPATK